EWYLRSAPGSSEAIRSANRAAFTSSNSDWVHGQCSLSMSAGYSGEHGSVENQAAIGVPGEFLVSSGFLRFAILLCSAHADLTAVSTIFTETSPVASTL